MMMMTTDRGKSHSTSASVSVSMIMGHVTADHVSYLDEDRKTVDAIRQ